MNRTQYNHMIEIFEPAVTGNQLNMSNIKRFFQSFSVPTILGVVEGSGTCIPEEVCLVTLHIINTRIPREYVRGTVHFGPTDTLRFSIGAAYTPLKCHYLEDRASLVPAKKTRKPWMVNGMQVTKRLGLQINAAEQQLRNDGRLQDGTYLSLNRQAAAARHKGNDALATLLEDITGNG